MNLNVFSKQSQKQKNKNMKKLLLNVPSKLTSFYVRTLSVIFLLLGVSTFSNAQCIGPYQGYESIPTTAGALTANGFTLGGSPAFSVTINSNTAARSGKTYIRQATAAITTTPTIISPKINTPLTFSFYVRGTAGLPYSFSFSDDAKATWVPITNGATTLTGGNGSFAVSSAIVPVLTSAVANSATNPMVLVTITAAFPADPDGYYFKIADERISGTTGNINIDDISWISSVSTDNKILIPNLNNGSTCNFTVPATGVYKLYDVGGDSDSYSDGQTNNFVFTPANTATDKVRVTFKNSFNTTVSQDFLNVYNSATIGTGAISGSPFSGGPFTTTATLPLSSNTPVNSFTSTFGTGDVAISFTSNGTYASTNTTQTGYEIWVECIPSVCADPTALVLGTVSSTTANMSWTGTASGGFEYATTATNSAPGAAGTSTLSNSCTFSGLTPNTQYYGWVRAYCGGASYSNWVGVGAFTTTCAPVGVPYSENFNGWSGPLPTCTSKSGGTWATNLTNGNLYGVSAGNFFFTKPITLTASTIYKLSYDFNALFGNVNFDVYVGPVNDMTMLVPANKIYSHTTVTSALTNNAFNFTSSATPGTYYIGFYIVSTTNPGITQLNLDNIFLDIETCIAPTAVTGSAPTASSGTVSWTAPSIVPGSGYQYYLGTSATPPVSSTAASGTVASGTSVVISGLTSSTTYYVWVRSNCGSGVTSFWSSTYATFTTSFVVTTTVNMQNGNNGPGGSCSVNFFDSAGASANYLDGETYTYTFYPGTAGSKLKAVFSSFRTETGFDGLMIYNGTSAIPANLISSGSAPGFNATTCPAGAFHGSNSPGTLYSTDPTGALTFVFTSDGSVTFSGWAATLSCVTVPTISSFTPSDNNCSVGTTTVVITGTNFTVPPVTGVFFNGVPAASYSVSSSTSLSAVLPASGVTTGVISISNATATGYSTTNFTINGPKPTTVGATICTGGTGNLTSSTTCGGYVNSGTSFSGNLDGAIDPTAPRISSMTNSPTCGFDTGVRNYVATTFQVNVTGTYTFESTGSPAFDSMGYIVRSPFTPGTCSSNWVVGDDDSGVGTFSQMSATLTAGVTYILYTTSWGTSGTYTGPFTWNITPPAGGQIMLPGVPQMDWYVNASTSTVLGSGNSFNPVGVSGSGLANTNTATSVTYYGACPSNPTCRTATVFLINARPTVTFTAQPGATACTYNNCTYTTQAGQSNYVWTIPGVLNTDYTIVSGGTSTSNTVTLQWLTTGSKTVTINYDNASGCSASSATSSTATSVSASGISTTVTPSSGSICANSPQILTATSGSANFFTWSTTSGALFTDAACTVPYVALSNSATVYFKGISNATVTVLGTVGGVGCNAPNTAAITINKAVWNGSVWSNAGAGPSNTISAEFQGNFTSSVNASATSGNLSACSVVVTSGNVLFDRGTLTVQNSVTVNAGALNFTDINYDVSLYQPNNVSNSAGVYSGGNTGNITFNRSSAPLFKFDYTYWSTPVYPQNLLAVSPGSPTNLFLDYNNAWQYILNPASTTMIPAKGYAIRAPLSYFVSPGMAQVYVAAFGGVPNNGDISIPVLGGASQMNLLGNPYPSALFADDFILANPNVNGTLYFWTHASQSTSPYQYAQTDYAVYTLAGGTGTTAQTSGPGAGNNSLPLGYIASGQGFFVKGLSNSTAVFTNSMRRAGNNKQFYRTTSATSDLEKNRYWLNILGENGAFKQALVGYIETATSGIDRLFDGELVDAGNVISLYTKVGDTKLSIQGRPLPFDIADTVPLIYKSTAATTYTISIPQADGLFNSQHVYLEDRVLNVIHDLMEGSYTFATEIGTFENRFVLRYTDSALGTTNPVFTESSVVVYKNNQKLYVNTGLEVMKTVTVFDITGRVLATQKQLNNTTTVFTTLPSTEQVLLVKIEGESGRVVTKKVVY